MSFSNFLEQALLDCANVPDATPIRLDVTCSRNEEGAFAITYYKRAAMVCIFINAGSFLTRDEVIDVFRSRLASKNLVVSKEHASHDQHAAFWHDPNWTPGAETTEQSPLGWGSCAVA